MIQTCWMPAFAGMTTVTIGAAAFGRVKMAIYTVHEPPLKRDETEPNPDRFVFVRDGFYFWAFLLTPLWMLRHRLWLVLLCYALIVSALGIILRTAGATGTVSAVVGFLVAILAGCEGGTLRRFTLARRGYKPVGLVVGDNRESAERRFFAEVPEIRGGRLCRAADACRPGAPAPPAAPSPAAGRHRQRRRCARARRATTCDRAVSRARRAMRRDGRDHRLRLGQSALGRQGLRARRPRDAGAAQPIVVTDDPDVVRRADRIVLPGVGAFADCWPASTRSRHGRGAEDGGATRGAPVPRHLRRHAADGRARAWNTATTRVSAGSPARSRRIDAGRPVAQGPAHGLEHAGRRARIRCSPASRPARTGSHAYFVHSYHLAPRSGDELVATTDYGGPVTAIVGRDNLVGTQFHPEKSQRLGLR